MVKSPPQTKFTTMALSRASPVIFFHESVSGLFPSGQIPWLGLLFTVAAAVGIYQVLSRTILQEDEAPTPFTVPIPDQCRPGWKGTVLDEPSIKVRPTH
jgi:hypothetical protein